jgi:putative nucleotidyltransferase with HDIG domain
MASSCRETDRHCRRVASLARSVAEHIGVAPVICDALESAALEHQKFRLPRLRQNHFEFPGAAGMILHRFAGGTNDLGPNIDSAATILRICDALDESAEFAGYDGQPLATAIQDFMVDAEQWPGEIMSALRHLVRPNVRFEPVERLPVLPSAAAALLRLQPETVSAAELAAVAEQDPVFAKRMLGLANSAAFGPANEIRSICDAVLRIGVPLAHKSLVAASFGPLFASGKLRAVWRHSQEIAALAHELASQSGCHPHQAWLAGLLHDIGRLIFASCSATDCSREEALRRAGFPRGYAETIVWGVDHATAGADLLAKWNVPPDLVEAVRHHAAPELSGSPLAALLYIANTIDRDAAGPVPDDNEPLASRFRLATALSMTNLPASVLESVSRESPIFAIAC